MGVRFTHTGRILGALAAVFFIFSYLYSNLIVTFAGAAILFYLIYRRLEFDSLKNRMELGIYREVLEKVAHKGSEVNIRLEIRSSETIGIDASEVLPRELLLSSGDILLRGTVHPEKPFSLTYGVTPQERGYFRYPPITVTIIEARGLFARDIVLDPSTELHVQASKEELALGHLMSRRKQFNIAGKAHARYARTHRSDFRSVREFIPGDRFRDIDWKASSRLTRLMTREFDTETNLPSVIMVDCSLSMRELVRKRTKLDHAIALAIQIALVFDSQSHPVGLISFNENRVLDSIPPLRGNVDDVLISLFKLPNPQETGGYPGPPSNEAPPEDEKSGEFLGQVGPFLQRRRAVPTKPDRITGIYDAVRSLQESSESGRIMILLSDMETNQFAIKKALSMAVAWKHRVITISPFSWPYHLQGEVITERTMERIYPDYIEKQALLDDLRKTGIKVIEMSSRERGDKIMAALRRMGQ